MQILVTVAIVIVIAVLILGLSGVVGAAAVFKSLILSKGGPVVVPAPAPPAPFSVWNITYSEGAPPTLTLDENNDYVSPIPLPPGSLHYVTTPAPAMNPGMTVTMRFAIKGSGTVVPKPGADTPPARLALYFQRRNDLMTGQGAYEFYRWWYTDRIDITNPGEYEIVAPLDPAKWTSVYGRSGADPLAGTYFQQALADAGVVGFTLGGNSFAGHGDQSSGSQMTLALHSFTVA